MQDGRNAACSADKSIEAGTVGTPTLSLGL